MDDIRPPGTVTVRCSHPGCEWHFWVLPDDPRLPDGPFSCGSTHEDDREAQLDALPAMFGITSGRRQYLGPRSDGRADEDACGYGGQRAGIVGFHDKWAAREGILRYEDISLLNDPRNIPGLITWFSPGMDLDENEEPYLTETPRMGGSYYSQDLSGKLVEHPQVLHRCPTCRRTFVLDVDHPLAFEGTPACGHSSSRGGYIGPCPVGEPAFQLDAALEAAHGPGTTWTMWQGSEAQERVTLSEYYASGQVLVRKADGPSFRFALLTYTNPGEILPFARHLRFGLLEDLPLDPKGCPCCSLGGRARLAIPFVRPLN